MTTVEAEYDPEKIGVAFIKWAAKYKEELYRTVDAAGISAEEAEAYYQQMMAMGIRDATTITLEERIRGRILLALVTHNRGIKALGENRFDDYVDMLIFSKELTSQIKTVCDGFFHGFVDGLSEKTTFAKNNAKKSHAEHYGMKEDVLNYWRENIDPKLSNEKAADIIFAKRIVSLSHRTIKNYISAERKKAR